MFIHRILAIFRLLSLMVLIGAPLAGLGMLFSGPLLSAVSGGVAALITLSFGFFSERWISFLSHARVDSQEGLRRSLDRVLELDGISDRHPEVLLIRDPIPGVLVARSWFSSGKIMLTQGLVSLLREDELRAVLRAAVLRCREPELVVRSVCAAMIATILRISPKAWVNLMAGQSAHSSATAELSPLRFIGYLLQIPLSSMLTRISGQPHELPLRLTQEVTWVTAVQKIENSLSFSGTPPTTQHLAGLALQSSWSRDPKLSLSSFH